MSKWEKYVGNGKFGVAKISEVHLSAFIYKLFHEHFPSIVGTITAWNLFRVGFVLLMTLSVRTFGVMYDQTFSSLANYQIRHQATHKVGCEPGECIWSLLSSSGVCVGIYGLTYSIAPEGGIYLGFLASPDISEFYRNSRPPGTHHCWVGNGSME